MATEKEFDEYVGRVMRICQGIEHDIKLIYCGIREDANDEDFDEVYQSISKTPLGQTLDKLYKIDHTYKQPYFSEKDYKILREITDIRNHWAHQGYVDWIYTNSKYTFSQKWDRLIKDYKRIEPLVKKLNEYAWNFLALI
mgnify:FL=1